MRMPGVRMVMRGAHRRRGRAGLFAMAVDAGMGMAFTRRDLLPVGGRCQVGQYFQESNQIPDCRVVHAALRPGRHPGTLDPMLDDPEATRRVGVDGGLCQLGWGRIKPATDFRRLDAGSKMALDAHCVVIAGAAADPGRIDQILRRHKLGDRPGQRTLARPSDQRHQARRMRLVGRKAQTAGLDHAARGGGNQDGAQKNEQNLFHGRAPGLSNTDYRPTRLTGN